MDRATYATDPQLFPRVLDLLGTVFGPSFTKAETVARSRGLRWDVCSRPFVIEQDGRVVAHAGVLEIPVVLAGASRVVAGLHAVATHPDYRGRGFMRRVTERALLYCDQLYETVVLTAGAPEIYAAVGFEVLTEYRFTCDSPPPTGSAAHRPLDWTDNADRARMHELLECRAPVSSRLGVTREHDVFLFDTAYTAELQVFEDLDLVAWTTREGTTLQILDLVAPRIPSLANILARIDGPIERVETYFAPDRLEATFVAEPHVLDGDDWFMVRGPFLPDSAQVMMPTSARC